MSFVPQPQRQNANNSQNAVTPTTAGAPAPAAAPVVDEGDLIFNIRTFDLFFIDRQSLMYRDGYAKVSFCVRGVCAECLCMLFRCNVGIISSHCHHVLFPIRLGI